MKQKNNSFYINILLKMFGGMIILGSVSCSQSTTFDPKENTVEDLSSFTASQDLSVNRQTGIEVKAVGWNTPILIENDSTYSVPLGLANAPISGSTIEDILKNPGVIIRPDGNSCISCHNGAGSLRPEWDASVLSKDQYCDLVESFVAAKKPEILKVVFSKWLANGCPE